MQLFLSPCSSPPRSFPVAKISLYLSLSLFLSVSHCSHGRSRREYRTYRARWPFARLTLFHLTRPPLSDRSRLLSLPPLLFSLYFSSLFHFPPFYRPTCSTTPLFLPRLFHNSGTLKIDRHFATGRLSREHSRDLLTFFFPQREIRSTRLHASLSVSLLLSFPFLFIFILAPTFERRGECIIPWFCVPRLPIDTHRRDILYTHIYPSTLTPSTNDTLLTFKRHDLCVCVYVCVFTCHTQVLVG